MTVLCFVDSNILIYTRDARSPEKQAKATEWIAQLMASDSLVVSFQIINEVYRVLSDKVPNQIRTESQDFAKSLIPYQRAPFNQEVFEKALEVQAKTNYGWWDCMHIASALLFKCSFYITEDMHHGHRIDGLQLISCFKVEPADILS